MKQGDWTEADITINGVPRTFAQSMTFRVMLGGFMQEMSNPEALGKDMHGLRMAQSYWKRASEISELVHSNQP